MTGRIGILRSLAAALVAVAGLLYPALLFAESDRLLGAPRFDTYSEATYKQVTWDDFKGGGQTPPGWNRWTGGSFAHIASAVRLGAFEVADREEDGRWVAVAVGLRPYAVMDKFHSAVRTGSRNDDVLAHEQLHFDITEAAARRLAVEMAAIEGRGDTAQEARVDLDRQIRERLEQAAAELEELQNRYDEETHGKKGRKRQEQWAVKVEAMLEEATDALTDLLERGGASDRTP